MQTREILEQVATGRLSVSEAERLLRPEPLANLGFAQVDLHRRQRCGFPEVIFCEGKTPDQVEGVVRELVRAGQDCFATRVSDTQAEHLRTCFPNAEQDRVGRTFWLPVSAQGRDVRGKVAVVTAGTADLPVAHEAFNTAKAMGCQVSLLADVGVAGIHRILRHAEQLRQADVIIVLAGMEGALPSVVGGLVDVPVVAVPTSVGYGASFHGLAALLGMLNSCAANVTVVNIDAGFKAGYVAALIARRMHAPV
ncbi:MAG: nickel pincer cofactor biosynthesis protein LarB [Gemmatales bacterium]|nr:nickel pincer cofactor biosynthesis protein LarB [Gemmatales bacterium]MDW8387467.1 nickel pincer cofactor biosynthesis protein LarB [Gemmatales bacterium]